MLIIAIFCLLATSKAWVLEASHKTVEIGRTENVSLVCRYGAASDSDTLVTIDRIRIYRKDPVLQNRKTTVAKIGVRDTPKNSRGRHVTGYFQPKNNIQASFVKITWPVATNDTPGEYGCEIDGYTNREHSHQELRTVTIEEQSLTLQDLLRMIEDSKKDFQEKQNSLEKEIKNLKKELANARNENENARQDFKESTKQNLTELRIESEEAFLILQNELAKHRQIYTILQQDISELKNITNDLKENLQDAISDFRKDLSKSIMQVNLTWATEFQEEISKLRRQSRESDAMIEAKIVALENETKDDVRKQIESLELRIQREVSDMLDQRDKCCYSLREEILRIKNVTINDIILRIRQNEENHEKEVLNIQREYIELKTNLQQQLVDLKISSQRKMLEQNQENDRAFQEILSKLENFTASEAERQERQNYTKLLEDISDLESTTGVISHKLHTEKILREREHQSTNAKIEKNLSDLQNFIVQKILNQSDMFHQILEQEHTDMNLSNQEKYEKLEQTISRLENKFEERNLIFFQELSDLKNISTETAMKEYKERITQIRDNISDLKNYTANEIRRIKEDVKERCMEASNMTKNDIEKKTMEALNKFQDDLINLRNFTVIELMKQEETDLSLKKQYALLSQDLKSKYVTKTELTQELLTLQNHAELDKIEWRDQLSELKNFTTSQIRIVAEKAEKESNMNYVKITNNSNVCKMNIDELWSNFTDMKKMLGNLVDVTEKGNNSTISFINDKMNRFAKEVYSLVNSIDDKYENVTNALQTGLTEKSQCVCPTAQPPKPTERVMTTELKPNPTMLPSSGTKSPTEAPLSSSGTQSPTETTLLSKGTQSPTGASLSSSVTRSPTETTLSSKGTRSPTGTTLSSRGTQSPTETATSFRTSTLPATSETTETTTPMATDWPEGIYAVVEPKSGCPDSEGFIWEEGWIQFHTATDHNQDEVTEENHFRQPLFRTDGIDNFVQIHYCLKKQTVSNAREWPQGSYCINRVNGQCPPGFKSGYIQYDEEHTHLQYRHKNAPDLEADFGSLERVYYCCRRDGSAEVAIRLPTIKPFFLYRAKGVPCQQVFGMRMKVEILQLDTNHEDNQDEVENPDNSPFALVHPIQHTLCYYSSL